MTSKSLVNRHVLVNGRHVRALFDSTVDGTSVRVQVANGNEGSTKGSALVQVSMGTQEDVTFGARLFVYDLPSHNVILGEDFMSQHQCTLDFGQRVISMTDGEGIHHDVTESTCQKRSMQGVVRASKELCSILRELAGDDDDVRELVGDDDDVSSTWTYMRDMGLHARHFTFQMVIHSQTNMILMYRLYGPICCSSRRKVTHRLRNTHRRNS
mmetsp:Transcript_5698/g.18768  ORF Transcript_5698/g.18768 Transcript_5698/m.18768 type:complete len:212 (-) Transcript_5698:177-812(-)